MLNDEKTSPDDTQGASVQAADGADAVDWKVKADEFKDKWLRTAADFDNYMKRQQRDRHKDDIYMRVRVLRKLLPPLDDLARALDHLPADLEGNSWVQGVILIERKFRSILDDFDVKPIESVGKPFDPAFHEALMTEASAQPEGIILEEFLRGYTLEDQIVRVASVKTSSGPDK